MASKKDNAMMLDPNRFKIAQQNSVMPGGPMNNNPMNVTSVGPQPSSLSGVNQYPYGDSGLANPPQLGADFINPQAITSSNSWQGNTAGQGLNSTAQYGLQPQPSPNAEEPMEGMRLGMDASTKGLMSSQFMGPTGSPALIPGALSPSIPGTGMPLGAMPTLASVDNGAMVPGSSPQKIQKKRGKK